MPDLTREQLDQFHRRGLLRLEALLCPERVRRAREHVLRGLSHAGLWKAGARRHSALRWPETILGTARLIGHKHPDVVGLVDDPALRSVVHALLDGCAADRAMSGGTQILCTLPGAGDWTVPTGWHVDSPRLASGRQPGVQVLLFLDTVAPRGGGTLVVAGSHRLLNDGQFIRSRQVRQRLSREAFFRELCADAPGRAQLLGRQATVDEVALEVMELSGAPGDAYLTDLRLVHTSAPNTSDRPRIMATHRFVRADVVQELTEGYGWGPA